jgi:thiazole synthase
MFHDLDDLTQSQPSTWQVAGQPLTNRLLLGTSRYPSFDTMVDAIHSSRAEVVTVGLRRLKLETSAENFWQKIASMGRLVLPSTAGCRTARDAIVLAQMAREIFGTDWVKLEVLGDNQSLQPDPTATLEAARVLVGEGFKVFAYTTEDLVQAQRLHGAGCSAVMPWAAPIGTGRGPMNPLALETMRQRLPDAVLIVDAGLGRPSHAVQVMEMGFDGVLLNTAVAKAGCLVRMARAFAHGVAAGRSAFEARPMEKRLQAQDSVLTAGLSPGDG